MFKNFLKILLFVYCFIFIFYFSIQTINEFDNYILNGNINNNAGANTVHPIDENVNNNKEANIVRPVIEEKNINKIFIENIPFTTQSPFANWEDPMQQDGCEEASSVMTLKWVKNEKLEKQEALNYIINISKYTEEKYGEYRDISVYHIKDWIFNDYFKYENVEVLENITKEIIINELNKNKVLLIPTDGRLLKNPNFVYPGPKTHMVVVRGYDISKNIFVVNDPGTRLGENYEYDMDILYNAIYSYPTGYHENVDSIEKNIIAVWK